MDKHSYNSDVEKSVLSMTRNPQDDSIKWRQKSVWQKQPKLGQMEKKWGLIALIYKDLL